MVRLFQNQESQIFKIHKTPQKQNFCDKMQNGHLLKMKNVHPENILESLFLSPREAN
jgi:hypothetical protein